ncbi:helix-turn-helix domain-containing protein [Paracoccus yeei]|uniref:helix-turn-helix domain-containing protein n=1 Tax=Paracoccus yeei TaxID=147645 RepID=UPI003BF803BC
MSEESRPAAPAPTAQIAPFVQVLGLDEAVRFILAFGGAELYIGKNPRDTNELVQMFGREAVEALANLATLPRRIPLAKPWLAAHFRARGLPIAQIARTLRISDVSVRAYLRQEAENRERLRSSAHARAKRAGPGRQGHG